MTNTTHNTPEAGLFGWLGYPFNLYNRLILALASRVGGQKAKEVERFLKFATVGIIGAVIDFGVLNLLQATILRPDEPDAGLKVAMATGAAFISAVSSNFTWNRYWTYPDSRTRPILQQLGQFFLVSSAGFIFRVLWVRTLFGPLGGFLVDVLEATGIADNIDATSQRRLGTNLAQFFAVWIVMIWNFFVNRYWTYNDVE